eukprot:gnl/TRDRNA2_/TRDRNA2_176108_c0_seq8.p1 gnl/TRDRNA2_/TRDRNA2_176108_c0~~gnl/TRDRNA2_/TRDRNA2_176108_c0_seq8.p1  ORF type:complete len:170 (+),score=16.74 gnl/TRDRNA2_/TRDRNA2_176108_c0_seq8:300-809(+)
MQLEHAVKMLLEASEERGPLIEAMMQKQADMQTLIDKLRRENYAIKERVASFIDMHKDGLASATVRCLSCHKRGVEQSNEMALTNLPSVTSPRPLRSPSSPFPMGLEKQHAIRQVCLTNGMRGSASAGIRRPTSRPSSALPRRQSASTAPSSDPELLRQAAHIEKFRSA